MHVMHDPGKVSTLQLFQLLFRITPKVDAKLIDQAQLAGRIHLGIDRRLGVCGPPPHQSAPGTVAHPARHY